MLVVKASIFLLNRIKNNSQPNYQVVLNRIAYYLLPVIGAALNLSDCHSSEGRCAMWPRAG